MKRVAVVILNYNGAEMLRRFLPSVIAHSPEADVYVADNGSEDGSRDAVREEFPAARLIELGRNFGFAEGYNRALAHIEEEYAVLLNSDVETTPSWLPPMLRFLDANPDAAACQPKVLSFRERDRFEYAGAAGGFIDKWGYAYCRGRVFGTVEKDTGQYDGTADVFWATGAAFMVRSKAYKEAGGLDAGFFAHMEEIDLCWRLRSRGFRVACVPESRVYHVGAATLRKGDPRKTYLNFRNNLLMIYKNAPDRRLASILRFRAVSDNAAALKFLLSGDAEAFRAVRKARRDFKSLRGEYAEARRENLRRTVVGDIPQMLGGSVLFRYYLKARRTYSSLQ